MEAVYGMWGGGTGDTDEGKVRLGLGLVSEHLIPKALYYEELCKSQS